MSKEKPIIFSTPMVQALLNTKPGVWPPEPIDEGKPFKSQTRRAIKPQPEYLYGDGRRKSYKWEDGIFALDFYPKRTALLDYCPYKPGDILWVRETFGIFNDEDEAVYLHYKADEGNPEKPKYFGKWKPSIFMPRKAARLFLEVKEVRVERLQDITEADAKAEGIAANCIAYDIEHCFTDEEIGCTACNKMNAVAFKKLWDTINAKRGYPWEDNPWVFVYEFIGSARRDYERVQNG